MAYFAIPTLAGQAALAAALNGEGDLTISEVVIGDGNGNPTAPLETQTGLVNLRATVPISSATRVGNVTTFEGVIDEDTGGFVIREAGLVDADGTLLFVVSIPATEKLTTAENAFDVLTLGLQVIVSETANVVLQPPAGSLVSIADMIRAPYFTVDSATTTAPPANPGNDNLYLVPVGATGAWVGNDNNLAQWNGSAWVFKIVPATHIVGVADMNMYLRRTTTGWRSLFASEAEHLAGEVGNYPATPAGVAAMIAAATAGFRNLPASDSVGVLHNDGAGNLSWRGRPVFTGTAAPTTATGVIGGMYLNTVTGQFYGPRVGENWGNPLPVPFSIAALTPLATLTGQTRLAVTDGVNNRTATVEQIATQSDYLHSEMLFMGMM